MLNGIWLCLLVFSVILGLFTGRSEAVVASVTESAAHSIQLIIGLTGILCFWLGIMRIAEEAGLVRALGKGLNPLMTLLFPEVPSNHPAMGAMVLNIAANMLGLNNAATPFGVRAMEALQTLNPHREDASNAMCTFLAINTSSVQLIPLTAMALLSAAGSNDPSAIVVTSLLATTVSTVTAIVAVKAFERLSWFTKSVE